MELEKNIKNGSGQSPCQVTKKEEVTKRRSNEKEVKQHGMNKRVLI